MIKRAPSEVPWIRKKEDRNQISEFVHHWSQQKNSDGVKKLQRIVVNIDESSTFEMTEHEGHTQFITNNDTDINKTAFWGD